MEEMTLNNGQVVSSKATKRNSYHMLPVVDWLSDIDVPVIASPATEGESADQPIDLATMVGELVEVQFKNTRKGYYRNTAHLPLEKGSLVAVEAAIGHDIGEVTLTGALVPRQMKKYHIDLSRYELRQVYRFATPQDLQRQQEAQAKEHDTMIKARELAKSLGLLMKIGDVEYQGDGSKAIFYYIADDRVDFRQLIKVYAETFRVRIEMKQIGARQEAGRIGGTGPCGRELCCSTWLTNFHSVGTNAARVQNLSLNPQKLAGQCAKLKCCLNYEMEVYEDAISLLPDRNKPLETQAGTWYYFSADALAGQVTYSSEPKIPRDLQVLTPLQAKEIIAMNERGEKPLSLGGKSTTVEAVEVGYQNALEGGSLTRFDKNKRRDNNRGRDDKRHRDDRHRENHAKQDRQEKETKPQTEQPAKQKPAQEQGKSKMGRVNRPR